MVTETHPPPSRAAFIIPALALMFIALFVGQALIRAWVLHLEHDVRAILIDGFTRWGLYAAFAPAVGALVARYPIESGQLARRWALHIAATVGFAVAHSIAMGVVYRIFHVYPREDSIFEAIGRLLMTFFAVNVVIFGAISGVYHSIRYQREAMKREQLAAELRTRLVESRLDALRAQLNPHFLFNTLNAASTLVLTGERDQVIRVLSRLSDLLRVSLDRELPQEIPLADELELLEGYLDIQRMRFGDRLTIELEVPAETRAALLPSMLLQPLVENALHHGIEARPGPGRVLVGVERREASLVLRVTDSGPGFVPHEASPRNGIGLANTRARLEQLYGDGQSLECGNLSEGGAFVRVVLPFHTTPAVERSARDHA